MESSTTKVPPRHPFHGMRRKSEASIKTIMESGRDLRVSSKKVSKISSVPRNLGEMEITYRHSSNIENGELIDSAPNEIKMLGTDEDSDDEMHVMKKSQDIAFSSPVLEETRDMNRSAFKKKRGSQFNLQRSLMINSVPRYMGEASTRLIGQPGNVSESLNGKPNDIDINSKIYETISEMVAMKLSDSLDEIVQLREETNNLRFSVKNGQDKRYLSFGRRSAGNGENPLPLDTFSMMMMSEPFSIPWLFGVLINIIQVTLFIIFLQMSIGKYMGYSDSIAIGRINFGSLSPYEQMLHFLAKYISVPLIFLFQTDMLEAIKGIYTDFKYSTGKWRVLLKGDNQKPLEFGESDKRVWDTRILFPICLKLLEGLLGFFVCVMFIVLSNNVIDLYKDFASLLIVSELDDKAFWLANSGFFGLTCQEKTVQVSNATLPDYYLQTRHLEGKKSLPKHSRLLVYLFILAVVFVILGDVGVFLRLQNGYNECYVKYPAIVGDNYCNYGSYNTPECRYDGGDCKNSTNFPLCFVADPSRLGNGNCDGDHYNTSLCEFDGGDCIVNPLQDFPFCSVEDPSLLGDGNCDNDKVGYNVLNCRFDGGDCIPRSASEKGYPECYVFNLNLLGDGTCDASYPGYNSTECGFDDGDCIPVEADNLPGCFVTNPTLLADGICHDVLLNYSSPECGYDGGDCLCQNQTETGSVQSSQCIEGLVNAELEGFPYCFVESSFVSYLGDQYCDNELYPDLNTGVCNYDGGDCIIDGLPGCHARDPSRLGNMQCDSNLTGYNTVECNFDGGDCEPIEAEGFPGCFVHRPDLLGDGVCNVDYPGMNTTICNYDDGDCIYNLTQVDGYPECYVTDVGIIGNGICDIEYDTAECGFDGDDCTLKPVEGFEGCFVTNPELISDGDCNWEFPNYYTPQCGFDGADCLFI